MIYEKEWANPNYKFLSYETENLNRYIHFHESFEICFVTEGEIDICIGEREYHLRSGEAVVIFPRQLHRYTTAEYSRLHIITFMPELVPQFADRFKNLLPKDNFLAGLDKYRNSLTPDDLFMQKGLIYSVMGSFAKGREFTEFQANKETRMLIRVLKFIERNYAGECSLKEAAEEVSYSYAYLSRAFKRLMHMSYNEYVNRYRINRAVYLLSSDSNMSVQEAASACGYESLCSFNRNFKEFTGTTPRQIRGTGA